MHRRTLPNLIGRISKNAARESRGRTCLRGPPKNRPCRIIHARIGPSFARRCSHVLDTCSPAAGTSRKREPSPRARRHRHRDRTQQSDGVATLRDSDRATPRPVGARSSRQRNGALSRLVAMRLRWRLLGASLLAIRDPPPPGSWASLTAPRWGWSRRQECLKFRLWRERRSKR